MTFQTRFKHPGYVAGAYVFTSVIINVAIYWLSGPRDFRAFEPHRNLLIPWAIGLNFATVLLILVFSHFAAWKRHLGRVLTFDIITSVISFALVWCLSISTETMRAQLFVCLYTIFVFAKGLLLVFYALVNVKEDARAPVRAWVFAVSLVVYVAITPLVAVGAPTEGDESFYLILSHSLAVDQDFNLENNFRQRDYKPFFWRDLPPDDHHALYNSRQEEVLIHDVGTSVLLVPGYALAKRLGAMIESNLIGALAALGVFVLALQIGATQRESLIAWALLAFTSPIVVFSSQIFPEIAGAACTVWAMICFTKVVKDGRWRYLILVGFLLGFLPWLSIRFWNISAPLSLIIALFVLVHRERSGWMTVSKRLLMLLTPLTLSLALFSLFDKRYYDTFYPNAGAVILGSQPDRLSYWLFTPKGMLGMLLDRAYGLLVTTPIYIIAIAGAVVLLRRKSAKERWVNITLVLISAICTFSPGTNFWWTGGWSPPSRYLVSTVVLWGPLAALVVLKKKARILVVVLSAWSFFIAAAFTAFPIRRYGLQATTGALSQFINTQTGFNYEVVFPSFIRAATFDYILGGFWIAVIVLFTWRLSKNPIAA
jgi:hypothetical protein